MRLRVVVTLVLGVALATAWPAAAYGAPTARAAASAGSSPAARHQQAGPWDERASARARASAASAQVEPHDATTTPALVSPIGVPLDVGVTLSARSKATVTGLAEGNFTGSGHTDLAVAFGIQSASDPTGNLLQILPGNGDGTFGTPIDLPVPSAVASAGGGLLNGLIGVNLTGSGPEDLVVGIQLGGNPDDTGLLVLTPTAVPTAWNDQVLELPDGAKQVQAYRLASGDVLLAALMTNDDVVPILTDGTADTANWTVGSALAPIVGYQVTDLAVAPLTAGGLPDIIVTVSLLDDGLEVWDNSGSNTFSGSPVQVNDGMDSSDGLWVGDFDGSNPSVLVAGTNCTVGPYGDCQIVVPGNGNGTFATPTAADAAAGVVDPTRGGTDGSIPPDLNGDGHPDGLWVSAGSTQQNSILEVGLGDGAGGVTTREQVDTGEPDTITTTVVAAPLTGGADWVVVGGVSDVNGAGGLWLLPPDPADPGGFVSGTVYPPEAPADAGTVEVYDQTVAVGDFDKADSGPDLVTVGSISGKPDPGTIDVLHPAGDGRFGTITDQNVTFASYQPGPGGLIGADLNGSGDLDLVWTTEYGIGWALGNGDGTFQAPADLQDSLSGGLGEQSLQWLELGPDGPWAIVVTGQDGNLDGDIWIEVYTWNASSGTFNPPINTNVGAPATTTASYQVAFGAFANGGDTDAVVVNGASVDLLPGNGDGTFGAPVTVATEPEGAGGWGAVTAGDVNGDGNLDLVWEDAAYVYVALGNGNGTFQSPVSYPEDASPASQDYGAHQLLLADLSGKGPLDVVSVGGGESTTGITVLPNDGDGTFGSPQPYALGNNDAVDGWATAASLAGGTAQDLVFGAGQNDEINLITVLLSSGGAGLVASDVASPGASVTPGQSVTTSWTVTNDNGATVDGPWTDSVYLAPRPTFDPSADRLVGTVTHTAPVAPGGSYTASLAATLPGVPAGTGYLVVVPDSGGLYASSAPASSPPFTVSPVPTLAVNGAATTGTIADGQVEYFQVLPQAGIPLSIAWTFGVFGSATISESLGAFPDPATGAADQTVSPTTIEQSSLTVTHPDAATYYVMLQGRSPAGAGTTFSLTATQAAFSITGLDTDGGIPELGGGWVGTAVACEQLARSGLQCGTPPDTLDIDGSGFTPSTTFTLVGSGFQSGYTIAATSVTIVNPTTAVATFPIRTVVVPIDEPPDLFFGDFKVQAANSSGTATSSQFVPVYNNAAFNCGYGSAYGDCYGGTNQSIQVSATALDFRPPAPATVTVSWYNDSGWDVPAPLIELEGTNAVLDDPATGLTTDQSSAQILGVGNGPDAGTLLPGESGSITLTYTQPTVGVSSFTAYTVNAAYQPDWSQLGAALQPPGVPNAAWSVEWANIVADLGGGTPTMGQLQDLLDNAATYLAQLGEQPDGDATQEIDLELASADDFGTISGEFTAGALGVGQIDPTNLGLTTDSYGNVLIRDGSGTDYFVLEPGGDYVPLSGGTEQLTKEGDGSWQLALPGGTVDTWNAAGQFVSSTDPHGNTLTASYNGSGELTSLTSSLGGTSTLTYDASGHVLSDTGPSGRSVDYAYDSSGRLASTTYGPESVSYTYGNPAGAPAGNEVTKVTYGAGETETLTYDSRGRLASAGFGSDVDTYSYGPFGEVTITNPAGDATSYWLDEYGRVAKTSDPLGRVTTYAYAPDGSLSDVVTPSGASTAYDFGSDGQLLSETDPMGRTTSYTYTPNLQLASATDPAGNTTTYGYDAVGDLTSITLPDGSTATATYDSAGFPVTETSPDGVTATYSYNADNELDQVAYSDGTTLSYGYDAAGDLTSATDPSGTVTYGYDSAGNLTSLAYGGHTLTLAYDADGRLVSTSDDSGFGLTAAYDSQGQLATITDSSGTVLARYTYDASGQVVGVAKSNGTTTSYSYDAAGELTGVDNTGPGNVTDSDASESYDLDGLPVSVTTPAGTSSYAYDADGELIAASEPGHSQSYSYDADGNRTSSTADGTTTTYAVNSRDEYTSVGSETLAYDADGDLTRISGPAGTSSFSYSDEGDLVSASTPAGSATSAYDALGDLLSTTSGGSTTSYLPDPESLAGVFTTYGNSGAVAGHAVEGLAGLLASESSSGSVTFFDTDPDANVVDATGATGAVSSSATFDPFGDVLSGSSTGGVGFSGATGDLTQPTGLVYAKARSYDPSLGRFLSPDPAAAPGANPYTYALDSPAALVDTTGRAPGGWAPSGSPPPAPPSPQPPTITALDQTTSTTNPLSWVPAAMSGGASYLEGGAGATTEGGIYAVGGSPALLKSGAGVVSTGFSVVSTGVSAYQAYQSYKRGDTLGTIENVAKTAGNAGTIFLPPPLSLAASGSMALAGAAGETLGRWSVPADDPQWGMRAHQLFPSGYIPSGATSSTNLFDSDPNNIFGPSGYGKAGWVTDSATLPYQITFENDKTATAPVQVATISETLAAGADPSSFRFGPLGFGTITASPPAGSDDWSITVPDTATVSVRVQGSLDAASGVISWVFTAVDPATGEKVSNPDAGFLPPDVTPPEGDAYVDYAVSPKAGLATGTTLAAKATIVFDTNAPIDTPTWTNTVDAAVPSASVAALPASTTAGALKVSWSGSDKGGPGVARYDVFESVDRKPFTLLATMTAATSTTVHTSVGNTYGFAAVAVDDLGLRGAVPKLAQTTTTAIPPQGYYLLGRSGKVLSSGGVPALAGFATAASDPAVGIATTPDGKGYFAVTADGLVFTAGDAVNHGELHSGVHDIVSIVATANGGGYWLLGADGQVYTFGNADYHGDLLHLPGGKQVHVTNIVGMVTTPTGSGYILIGSDGGVFALGAVHFYGSLPGLGVDVDDIRGILPAPGETGYVLVGADGGAFVFGHGAPYKGSLPGEGITVDDVVGLALTPDGQGYWMAGSNGSVYPFGDATRYAAPAGLAAAVPIVAIGGS